MTNTREDSPQQVAIPFSDHPRSRIRYGFDSFMGESFGIYSCRFSADGNEVVAGGNGKIFGLCSYGNQILLPHLFSNSL
jgi:WD repeat-containing protein 23